MTHDEPTLDHRPIHALLRDLAERGMRVHTLLVHHHGRTVLDLWQWPHEPELKHKIHSATKSFTSAAVGFAEAEGLLSLEDPVAGFFRDRLPAEPGVNFGKMRVRDLLTMRTGHARGLSGATTRLRRTGWAGEFLEEPVVEPPGRNFTYSSTTSHVLSAIVQEVSGHPVDEYLRPRLFDPLGITDYTWERDPEGVSSGGNGLSLRPRDLLKFGVLHLQDGMWDGARVLPGGWVQKATALHVARAISGEWNGKELVAPAPDVVTEEGYGYQFWTTPDGIYNASGIFGQECMVFPRHAGVVVVLGAMGDGTYHDLPGMLRSSFRAAFESSAADPSEVDAVTQWAARVRQPDELSATPQRPGFSATYDFEHNDQGLRSLGVTATDTSVTLRVQDDAGTHTLDHGIGSWRRQDTGVSVWRLHHSYQDPSAAVLAAAEWSSPDDLTLTWHFLEAPFLDHLTLHFDATGITVGHSTNVNSGPSTLPPARGLLRE